MGDRRLKVAVGRDRRGKRSWCPYASQSWQYLVYFFLLVAVILIGLQIWSAFSTSGIVSAAKQAVATGQEDNIERERAREELIGRRIENEAKGLIQNLLATGFSALAAALVTIAGAILAVRGYLDTREKERQDRLDTRQKERADQLATMLNETVTRLVSNEARQRVGAPRDWSPSSRPTAAISIWRT